LVRPAVAPCLERLISASDRYQCFRRPKTGNDCTQLFSHSRSLAGDSVQRLKVAARLARMAAH
jgi:hypothetical protein